MTKDFTTDGLLYPLTKGDLPGHPFHGNQYQQGSGTSVPSGIHTINGKDVTIAPRANLSNANLYGADLTGVDLSNANLLNASLFNADLRYADLTGADLSKANLRSADLTSADLTNTNLTNTNLTGANLSDTNLYHANLTGTRGDENTKLPPTHEVVNGFVVAMGQ